MKFKDLILESEVESFLEYLEDDFQIYKRPLYRGSTKNIDTYMVFSPRKDRNPQATSQKAQDLSVVIGEVFYPSHPNREKSRFGSFFEMTARSYNENTYYFFPHKEAKVSFYAQDTYPDYFGYIPNKYKIIQRSFDELGNDVHNLVADLKRNFMKLAEMIFGLWELEKGDKDFLKNVLNDFSDVETVVQYINSNLSHESNDEDGYVDRILSSFKFILKRIKKYFEDGKREVYIGDEVIVEGEYMVVNMEWLNKNIGKEKIWGRDKYSSGPMTNQEK